MSDRLVCFGFGYVAAALARRLAKEGWRVAATARSPAAGAAVEAAGYDVAPWTEAGLAPEVFEGARAVLISTPPGAQGCPAFHAGNALIGARRRDVQWIGYLSSTAVYGDHQGAVVDEQGALLTTSDRGFRRIGAEAHWSSFGVESEIPVVIFRLAAIYGPGRSAFDTLREGRARRIDKPGHVVNRTHVDDIAAALALSISDPAAGDLFNIADDAPAPPQDVIAFAAELLNVPVPPLEAYESAVLPAEMAGFYAETKRISNARARGALGWSLQHPSYREGLKAILAAGG